MMSTLRCRKRSRSRMCSMLASDPVSRLSTQMTRLERASSSSQRCEPRNPAPPVTRQVATHPEDTRARRRSLAGVDACAWPISSSSMAIAHPTDDDPKELTVAPIVGPDDERRFTDSGIEIAKLYTESDVPD